MPEIATTKLPYADYYGTTQLSGGLGTLNGKGNGKTALVSYTLLKHASKNGKVHTTAVDITRLN